MFMPLIIIHVFIWLELKNIAGTILAETQSPTLEELPQLEHNQKGRVDHQLQLSSY